MRKFTVYSLLCLVLIVLSSSSSFSEKKIKCLIELQDYKGEGAYLVISLISPENKYVKTLFVNGNDDEWYYEITSWWKHYGKNKYSLDGITGGTIASGAKKVNVFNLSEEYINKGYKIRFESAVEKNNYFTQDLEVVLKDGNLTKKISGKGFIRYVRFLPV
jgi:hypothetical protein